MGADEGMGRRMVKSGAEQDVHSKWWRRHLLMKKGETSRVKRMTRRRERHLAAQDREDRDA